LQKIVKIPFNMKFTKDDARKELSAQIVAKGEKLSLSERSINEQLDTLIALMVDDETELEAFVEKVVPIFKTANANVRNDVSAGIKEYQEKNPSVKTQPSADPNKKDDPDTEIEKRLKALEEELNAARNEKRISGVKRDIIAKLKEKGVKNEEWANALLDEVNINDEFDVDAKVDTYVSLYNKFNATAPNDVTPHSTGGNAVDKQLSDTINEAKLAVKAMRFEPINN
jgi:hypothetical protein